MPAFVSGLGGRTHPAKQDVGLAAFRAFSASGHFPQQNEHERWNGKFEGFAGLGSFGCGANVSVSNLPSPTGKKAFLPTRRMSYDEKLYYGFSVGPSLERIFDARCTARRSGKTICQGRV
jgi:hypothetical protein